MKSIRGAQTNTSSYPGGLPASKSRYSLATLLGTLCVAFALYSFFPDETLLQNLTLTALLAGVTLAALWISYPAALRHLSIKPFCGIATWVVCVGLFGGIELLALNGIAAQSESSFALLLMPTILLCLLTGVFEEGFFRALLMNALVEQGPAVKHPWLMAAVLSSLLFALLHVPLTALYGDNTLALLQVLLKLLQTGTFGMIMAGLYAAKKNLWPCALIHGVFNTFYLGPVFLEVAVPTTYLPGAMDDLIVLASTLPLLIAPALILWRRLLASESTR